MDAGSGDVGDLGCSERGFSAPSNQTATSTDAPGDAFRALPANAAANVATATTASAAQGAMLLHGECEGFAWLATAAGLLFRERLLEHGAKGGYCWRHLAATKGSRAAPHGRDICTPPRHARPA